MKEGRKGRMNTGTNLGPAPTCFRHPARRFGNRPARHRFHGRPAPHPQIRRKWFILLIVSNVHSNCVGKRNYKHHGRQLHPSCLIVPRRGGQGVRWFWPNRIPVPDWELPVFPLPIPLSALRPPRVTFYLKTRLTVHNPMSQMQVDGFETAPPIVIVRVEQL
jgi:hypothetical protein